MKYMIKELEYYTYLIFGGCVPSEIKINEISNYLKQIDEKYSLIGSQIFNSCYIWGYSHIYSAIWHAERAFSTKRMISKTFSMEIMLYLTGHRQIKKAIDLIGIKSDTRCIIGVLGAKESRTLSKAYQELKKLLQFSSDQDIIQNLHVKEKFVKEQLLNEGYESANTFSFDEIEKTILQRIALLTLES